MSRSRDAASVSGLTQIAETPATHRPVRTLDRLTDHAHATEGIREHEIRTGDWVVVHTRNSTYSMAALGEGRFLISGGWFTAGGAEHIPVRIVGCTWGGSAIHTRMVAAAGMGLEFDNGVRTTRVRSVQLIRGGDSRAH